MGTEKHLGKIASLSLHRPCGRILFSRPSSPRCLTHIHVGVGFDRVGLRNRCSLNWAGSGLPRVCGFNSHSASSNCVYFTNFIHPTTSPPLFHPLSSMIPFLKSASSKPGRWSNPRNLSPGKPMCGFNSHSASLIFVLQIFIQPPPRRLPSFPLPGRLRNASKHPHHPPFAPSMEWASPQSQLWF